MVASLGFRVGVAGVEEGGAALRLLANAARSPGVRGVALDGVQSDTGASDSREYARGLGSSSVSELQR